MTTPYMAALAALDERQEEVQAFVSPLGDQSAEVDATEEAAAVVARPDPVRELETKAEQVRIMRRLLFLPSYPPQQ